jgi:hypothetical protein
VAYDGDKAVVCWEYFNGDDQTTMHRNLYNLRDRTPKWIRKLGGDPDNWVLTITDKDPLLDPIFNEMEEKGLPWPTEVVIRHKNVPQLHENWRRENQEFVNNMAAHNKLFFHDYQDWADVDDNESPGAYQIHDQVMNCVDVADDPDRESKASNLKGWEVSDPWRGDHVLDAWYLAIWTICSQQLLVHSLGTDHTYDDKDPWTRQKVAFAKQFQDQERRELGMAAAAPGDWKTRNLQSIAGSAILPRGGYYSDES